MPRLILCADDYGHTRQISRTIIELARAGKLNAISCMAAAPGWQRDAEWLLGLPSEVEIGLHIVLTDEVPLTNMPLLAPNGRLPGCDELGRRAWLGRLPLAEIEREVAAQFDRFGRVLGRAPAFVDGHQHIHLLRGIRKIIFEQTAWRAPNAWLRSCSDSLPAMLSRPFKLKALAHAVQSRGFAREAARHGLRCNDSFAGLYDFSSDFGRLLPAFLRGAGERHLVICHPGDGLAKGDGIAKARRHEAAVLRLVSISDMAGSQGLAFGFEQ